MICPNCRTDNPSGPKFCQECGTRLDRKCPNCGETNPAGAKFCTHCGEPLALPATTLRPPAAGGASLEGFIPPELAQKLRSARTSAAMVGERRVVTILFCDVTGSTSAAEFLDPEEWTEIINGAFEHMVRPVYRYEGTVARLMGDGLLAFFGAPLAHEDDPQRAVMAGLEIQDRIAGYGRQTRERWGIEINTRVGINTGLVVVGAVGSDLRMEYTAIGDAINLAARLEQTAAPGSVQVGEETYKLVAPLFAFEDLGLLDMRGREQPVHVYRPLSARGQPGSLRGLEAHGIHSAMVGRSRELAQLRSELARLKAGEGSFTMLVGEAGLGKSRLIRELQGGTNVRWLQGQSISLGRPVSYHPWREVIRQAIGATDADSPGAVREKLRSTCRRSERPDEDIPFLEALLAVESPQALEKLQGYEGQALVNRITESVRGFISGLTLLEPLAIVFDDLHWADEASLDLLLKTADLAARSPLMFLAALRPDRQAPSWQFRGKLMALAGVTVQELFLKPLSARDSGMLLDNLLAIDMLPAEVREGVLQRAEGNPFYVEEVIRMLIDNQRIVRRDSAWALAGSFDPQEIPPSLQGVLAARLDRLSEEQKHTLQVAAVIGRKFHANVLAEILETS